MLYQEIGAANTIIRRPSDGKLVGYNTDCEASITAIEDALKRNDITIIIILPSNGAF
jgi:3-dehydroquinate dehydratase/shikimate dehydrogenase